MAQFNNRHYYKIDVMGRDGYSFMISTLNPLEYEDEAIDIAWDLGCFNDKDDVNYAIVDDLVGEHDIKHFIDCKCCYQY
jgi:hypothetical protein